MEKRCWFCHRTEEQLEKDIPDYSQEEDGIKKTELSNRNMLICRNCEDIVGGICVKTYNDLEEK